VCGGGSSTYVVGNRGTETTSFSMRSNKETVEGDVLEPGQLSAPFEISFEGALSQIEILGRSDLSFTELDTPELLHEILSSAQSSA
jgi:hypothetical protein